jgi:hypothetical protein
MNTEFSMFDKKPR